METEHYSAKSFGQRGLPTGKQKAEPSPALALPAQESLSQEENDLSGRLSENISDEKLSPFCSYLRHTLKLDRTEIARIATELEVAENTIYRWLNGNTEPRPNHLKKLVDLFPRHRLELTYVIDQTFPGVLNSYATDVRELQKDIYQRVLELASTIVENDDRHWNITQAIFEDALLHLDSERLGLAISFAKLMPRHEDGYHSLYEAEMRGTYPWPSSIECQAYLGSTTLAGRAAMSQRMQTWDDMDNTERLLVAVDAFERSACAYPVMHAGRIAGVLIVSSTQPKFFAKPLACQAVVEYARLLALGLKESEFYPGQDLNLKPMPDLKWQCAEISHSYMNRVIAYARQRKLALPEAEEYVRIDLEEEFEKIAAGMN